MIRFQQTVLADFQACGKPIALAITCIHWFNPLVWLAFYMMSRDCEISCDEKVVTLLGEESKKTYSYALLDEATRGQRLQYKRKNTCAVLSFGEDGIKTRIKHVLNFKKAPAWLLVCTAVLLAVLVVGLCSNAGSEGLQEDVPAEDMEGSEATEPSGKESDESVDDKADPASDKKPDDASEGDSENAGEIENAEGNSLTKSQRTVGVALERWAIAFTDRDGQTMYELSYDKENLEAWDMITVSEDGYRVGEYSPWPSGMDFDIQYDKSTREAIIRYWMTNSVPEIYPAYETVKVVEADGLYYIDHQSFTVYESIDTKAQLEAAYGKAYEAGQPYELYLNTGYGKAFSRAIISHVFYNTDPEYYDAYKDPVSAAKMLLHLGEGTGEVTEYLHRAASMVQIMNQTADADAGDRDSWLGEGSIVLVSYTFAADDNDFSRMLQNIVSVKGTEHTVWHWKMRKRPG